MLRPLVITALAALLSFAAFAQNAPILTVDELKAVELPDVTITSVVHHPEGSNDQYHVGHVVIDAVIGPAIRIEVVLPDDWNGRFAMGGGGGLVGSVQNVARGSVNLGYATAGTDTGHQGSGTDGSFALNDLEALVTFGHVAIHRTAEVSKGFMRAYYGKNPEKSYFLGCSRGGGQAMMEAQRYPDDFDGIVAGAPAFHWTGFAAMGVNIAKTLYPDPNKLTETVLTQEDLNRVYASVMEQADEQDGLKDGIIDDPTAVTFDLDKVPGLSDTQRNALKVIYSGVSNDKGPIYPGFPIGAEGGEGGLFPWQVGPIPNIVNLGFAFATNIYKYFIFQDPDWDYSTYDFNNWEEDTELAASVLNATDPDLKPFAERGGKLILWHGWSDAALPAQATIDYYESVLAHDPNATDYVRLFMIPGCYHCGGGPGISGVDWLGEIRAWVEEGKAPDKIIAERRDNGAEKSRPLVPYPQRVEYDGDGDPNLASNFALREN